MLGMIFGVAAVVAMLSIGAGAQQEVMAFIEQLGVRNLIVEAREAPDSPGAAEGPQAVAGPELPGLPRHPGEPRGHHRGDRAQALHAVEAAAASAGDDPPIVYGVSPGIRRDREPDARVRPILRRRRDRGGGAAWPCSAKPPRRRSSAPTIRSAATSRSTSSGSR